MFFVNFWYSFSSGHSDVKDNKKEQSCQQRWCGRLQQFIQCFVKS